MAELPKGPIKSLTKSEQVGVVTTYIMGARQRRDAVLGPYYESLLGELLGPSKIKG